MFTIAKLLFFLRGRPNQHVYSLASICFYLDFPRGEKEERAGHFSIPFPVTQHKLDAVVGIQGSRFLLRLSPQHSSCGAIPWGELVLKRTDPTRSQLSRVLISLALRLLLCASRHSWLLNFYRTWKLEWKLTPPPSPSFLPHSLVLPFSIIMSFLLSLFPLVICVHSRCISSSSLF